MQNIRNLIGPKHVYVSNILNFHSANINEMWNARKLGKIYKNITIYTNLKFTFVGMV